ncbi:hemerythrin domain-containing protein [Aestuariibius sp. HNIBRBA575]|uniref:hemerythrin domain-containing protein n=1 Tax=Aestuariibius sp. HNIBRBA575 TaxID=3233343 RepID=UPI0034A2B508
MPRKGGYRDQGAARGTHASPADPALKRDPLAYFAEEHLRQREICTMLDDLVHSVQCDTHTAQFVLDHLQNYLPQHAINERNDLYPLLRSRSLGDPDTNETLDRLIVEHEKSHNMVTMMRNALNRMIADQVAFNQVESAAVSLFIEHERRHLIVENAIVLPLARARLTKADLKGLRERMQTRRDAYETGGDHAE